MSDSNRSSRIIAEAELVWDMTVPWLPIYWDMSVLARYKQAGFSFVSLTLQDWPPTFDGMRRCIGRFRRLAAAEPWLTFATSVEQIDQGRRDGKLVLGLNSQETRMIEEDLSRIQALHDLGVRHMLLAYNVRNLIADGCAEAGDAGLSNYGRDVVREMNRVGILVDCSHTGRRSSLEAIDLSERPVIFSHSNAHAVCPHIRNVDDEQIRACAARDGVIGVVGVGAFVGKVKPAAEDLFAHIDHIASLVGARHVGLGTDYVNILPVSEHQAAWAEGSTDVSSWPSSRYGWRDPTGTQIPFEQTYCYPPEGLRSLVDTMLNHGYSEEAIRGILGGNFRRVYSSLPAHAA